MRAVGWHPVTRRSSSRGDDNTERLGRMLETAQEISCKYPTTSLMVSSVPGIAGSLARLLSPGNVAKVGSQGPLTSCKPKRVQATCFKSRAQNDRASAYRICFAGRNLSLWVSAFEAHEVVQICLAFLAVLCEPEKCDNQHAHERQSISARAHLQQAFQRNDAHSRFTFPKIDMPWEQFATWRY